jgi:hypothetical protein
MKDWTAIAKANGFDIPPTELARVASILETLEQAFRPLAKQLAPEMEPAMVFRAEEENR